MAKAGCGPICLCFENHSRCSRSLPQQRLPPPPLPFLYPCPRNQGGCTFPNNVGPSPRLPHLPRLMRYGPQIRLYATSNAPTPKEMIASPPRLAISTISHLSSPKERKPPLIPFVLEFIHSYDFAKCSASPLSLPSLPRPRPSPPPPCPAALSPRPVSHISARPSAVFAASVALGTALPTAGEGGWTGTPRPL